MADYKLTRRFFDGKIVHPVGEVMSFADGAAPKSARKLTKPEPVVEADDTSDDQTTLSELTKKGGDPTVAVDQKEPAKADPLATKGKK